MPYKKRRQRERKRARLTAEAEARASRLVASLRQARDLDADQIVLDAALISEVLGYFPPGSLLVEPYLAARLDGRGNGVEERDALVGDLLLSRTRRGRAQLAEIEAMKRDARERLRQLAALKPAPPRLQ